MVRERILYKDSNNRAYFPLKWIADGDMDKAITTDDFFVYQLDSTGLAFEAVSSDEITSIDAFNNFILFEDDFTPTNQLYITYYACSKPLDEVLENELKRVVMAQVTILVIERLRKQWGLKGSTGWSAQGVVVNKDLSSYENLLGDSRAEYKSLIAFLKPFVGRAVRTNLGGTYSYDPNIAYSSQVLAGQRVRRTFSGRRW